jgi:hypothetical protein
MSYAEARGWLARAADQGNERAREELAKIGGPPTEAALEAESFTGGTGAG